MLQVGDRAPDFVGITSDEEELRLSDFSGQKVALYFYPKDNTFGCTAEACSIRDHWAEFEREDIIVIGVSPDSVKSHQKFTAKHDLPFLLLADTEKKIMTAYGVWSKKVIYGNTCLGVKRSTFLIDKAGRILKIFKRPKTRIHGREVLDAFAELHE